MKRKTLLKLTACGLAGALTIGNFTVTTYAAPTAGVASIASDIAASSAAPTAGFSLAISACAATVEDEAVVADTQPEVKEVEAPLVKSEYDDKAVAVVNDYVNIRKKPTTESKSVGKLYKDNVGTVLKLKNGWYKIQSGSVTGYVKAEYVSVGDEAKLKKAGRRVALVETETLKVRKGASQKAEVITLVPEGDDLTVLDESKDGWAKVSVDEGKGYVSTDYVTLSTEYTYAESAAEEKARLKKEQEEREAADRAAQAAQEAEAAAAAAADNSASTNTTTDSTSSTSSSTSSTSSSSTSSTPSDSSSTSSSSSASSSTNSSSTSSDSSSSDVSDAPSTSSSGAAVANYACQFIGNPYVYGGTSLTGGADCSGFVMAVYAHYGISLPHSSSALRSVGYGVSTSSMQPGDIVCYSGHVAIYVGNNTIVHASNARDGIKLTSPANYRTILAVRRIF